MNQKLGSTAQQEIRKAMTGLVGAAAKSEATRLADLHGCSVSHIYDITIDVRGHGKPRKRRSDAGRRKFDIVEGTDTWEVAQLVIGAKLDPDQALLTAKANGHTELPSLATTQRLLREKLGTRKRRDSGKRTHVRFEAAAPLDMIQIDCTALKIRWQDIKTRRILRIEGIDKNHPQLDATKVRVWQIMAVDDHTRRRFMRYVVCSHIQSKDMVKFFCELSCEWGLCLKVYTDNGPEFKGFFSKAVGIIGNISAVRDTGGFEHIKHTPGNSQASGKVEVAHKWAEKMDRYVGLAIAKGMEVTADKLDGFAEAICRDYNERHVNRSTGQTPLDRWFGTRTLQRMLPQATIQSALLFDEATRVLTDTWTVRVGKVDYKIPQTDVTTGKASPFKVGMRLTVVVPHELDEILVTMPNGIDEYYVKKQVAGADVALEWKSAADSDAEQLTKKLKASYKDANRAAKQQRELTGEVYQVPHFNHEVAAAETTNVRRFPHPEIAVSTADVQTVTPVPMDEVVAAAQAASPTTDNPQPATAYIGRPVGYWEAVAEFGDRFTDKQAAKSFLLSLFPGMEGSVPITEIEAAVHRHFNPQQEVASIRLAS